MRRGVVLPEDTSARRRTAATLPAELRVRGEQALFSLAERVSLALAGESAVRSTPRGVLPALRADRSALASAARRALTDGVLPGLKDPSATVALLRRARPDAEANTRGRADRSVDGVFELLGHEGVSFGNPIDWHLDPSTGRRAPLRHWSRIEYLDPNVVGDYKLLWEVNRHQHFVTLGQAYAYSRDSRYADAFVAQLTAWISANPPRVGVNWASSLEVSYRAISWLWALSLFAAAPQLTDEVLSAALESLRVHARHIERYLSTYYSPNTHLTGEALGLLYLGTFLPVFGAAARWKRLGWEILREQLFRQVRADGTYFEQALYYHRYTSDIYHHALLLAEANGWPRESALWKRVELLDEALMHVTRPNGIVPAVGDDDGGRLMRLDGRKCADARPTLATAAALFGRGDMRCVSGDAAEECLWLLGEQGASALAKHPAVQPRSGSRAFPDGGFYTLRDGWGADATWGLIDAGPHGALNCGHAHADALALELSVNGQPVLTDSGTFSYTGPERDRFRATDAHNTVTIDGESSSLVGGLFHWKHVARTVTRAWSAAAGVDFFKGAHDGFARLADPATHERTVVFFHRRYLVVLDVVAASLGHDLAARWHCAPGLTLRPEGENALQVVRTAHDDSPVLQIVALGPGTMAAGESWRSEAHGSRRLAACGIYTAAGTGRQRVATVLIPSPGQTRALTHEDGNLGVEVIGPSYRDLVTARGSAPSMQLSGVTSDAECAILSRSGDGSVARLSLLGATWVEGVGAGRVAVAPDALWTAEQVGGAWRAMTVGARSLELD